MIMLDPETMQFLVYQEEIGENGTYHFQGYCEFKYAMNLNPVKAVLGGDSVHIERRRGTAQQAINYCTKEDTRVPHTEPYASGSPKQQGKRLDLEGFKDEVMGGAKLRDVLDEHFGIIARYPKFYQTLTLLHRPIRENELEVSLFIGDTGLGKTRTVMDQFGTDTSFYRTPLNNGTMWFDGYDGHTAVLLDDFSGASSHVTLCTLLQLLDRYPLLVPTKGGHTWFMPDKIFVTTNVYPKDWYKWENRGEQYKALARRFHKVRLFYLSLSQLGGSYIDQEPIWWQENKPDQAVY